MSGPPEVTASPTPELAFAPAWWSAQGSASSSLKDGQPHLVSQYNPFIVASSFPAIKEVCEPHSCPDHHHQEATKSPGPEREATPEVGIGSYNPFLDSTASDDKLHCEESKETEAESGTLHRVRSKSFPQTVQRDYPNYFPKDSLSDDHAIVEMLSLPVSSPAATIQQLIDDCWTISVREHVCSPSNNSPNWRCVIKPAEEPNIPSGFGGTLGVHTNGQPVQEQSLLNLTAQRVYPPRPKFQKPSSAHFEMLIIEEDDIDEEGDLDTKDWVEKSLSESKQSEDIRRSVEMIQMNLQASSSLPVLRGVPQESENQGQSPTSGQLERAKKQKNANSGFKVKQALTKSVSFLDVRRWAKRPESSLRSSDPLSFSTMEDDEEEDETPKAKEMTSDDASGDEKEKTMRSGDILRPAFVGSQKQMNESRKEKRKKEKERILSRWMKGNRKVHTGSNSSNNNKDHKRSPWHLLSRSNACTNNHDPKQECEEAPKPE